MAEAHLSDYAVKAKTSVWYKGVEFLELYCLLSCYNVLDVF